MLKPTHAISKEREKERKRERKKERKKERERERKRERGGWVDFMTHKMERDNKKLPERKCAYKKSLKYML